MVHRIIGNFLQVMRQRPLFFISLWVLQFAVIALVLISYGIAPAALYGDSDIIEVAEAEEPVIVDDTSAGEIITQTDEDARPVRILIDVLDKNVNIENPAATDLATLDESLTRGAVHYPGSGDLNDISNMFLFGHSSNLPFVQNKAYQAFNDIEKLEQGDLIRVQSQTHEYHYTVTSVEEVSANDAWVHFDTDTKSLTLSTCNTFGSKQDRFVVQATFIGSRAL